MTIIQRIRNLPTECRTVPTGEPFENTLIPGKHGDPLDWYIGSHLSTRLSMYKHVKKYDDPAVKYWKKL